MRRDDDARNVDHARTPSGVLVIPSRLSLGLRTQLQQALRLSDCAEGITPIAVRLSLVENVHRADLKGFELFEQRFAVLQFAGLQSMTQSRRNMVLLVAQQGADCFWQLHLAHFGGLFWPPCKRASKSLISGHLLSFLGTWSGAEPEGRSAGRCPQKRAPSLLPPSLLLRQRPTKAVGLLARLDDVSAVGNAIQQRLT